MIQFNQFTFTYPECNTPALRDISLGVAPGEFVVLCGKSGSGKSTLLRHMKPEIAPKGTSVGAILFWGNPTVDGRQSAEKIGFLDQHPPLVCEHVFAEIAFLLESLGTPPAEMHRRVAETASFLGLSALFRREVGSLSGGETARVALASVLVGDPQVLLLDEPAAALDPLAASAVWDLLRRVHRERGTAVVLAAHELDDCLPLADRLVVMDEGRIIANGAPRDVIASCGDNLLFPAPARLWFALNGGGTVPLTVREGRNWFQTMNPPLFVPKLRAEPCSPALTLHKVSFGFDRQSLLLRNVNFAVPAGQITALLGASGAGKSTLLELAAGLISPVRGKVTATGTRVLLPQDVKPLFCAETVRDCIGADNAWVASCRLTALLDRHPNDLSGGERMRAALAMALDRGADILLLDEPTQGLDAVFKRDFRQVLRQLAAQGTTILLVSHDVEFCAAVADHAALLFDGDVLGFDTARTFFSRNSFYTTAVHRITRDVLPSALTVEDATSFFLQKKGDKRHTAKKPHDSIITSPCTNDVLNLHVPATTEKPSCLNAQPANRRPLLVTTALIVATLATFFLGNRKFVFTSLLLTLEAMIPFWVSFLRRKPGAKEAVMVAVLAALAVAGRAAFEPLPQIKPMAAIVICTGVALGAEAGMLVGTLAMFLSNFFFGQGIWTPFQMCGMGLCGCVAGMMPKWFVGNRVTLAAFGGAVTWICYGSVVNLGTAVMISPNLAGWVAAMVAAVGFDAVHAGGTVVFLALIGHPLVQKISRAAMR